MNRREFLKALLGVGAVIALPVPIAQASPAQVDAVWTELVKRPWVFYVNDYGTIVDDDPREAQTRAEVFHVDPECLRNIDDVRDAIEGCYPLASHISWLAHERAVEIDQQLARAKLRDDERERLERLADLMRDDLDGAWVYWLDDEPDVEKFKGVIRCWLAESVDWDEADWFDIPGTNQSRAMKFFQYMPRKLLNALGVVIVEGEHPASQYYAAELRGNIDKANAVAAERALPFRFAREE